MNGPRSRMRFLYGDGLCRGLLLSRPWREFAPGMRRTCRMAISRLFSRYPRLEDGRVSPPGTRRIGDTGAPGGPILIVAGTRDQAQWRAEEMRLPLKTWRYASDGHSLRGWIPGSIEYYGTYYDRHDLHDELRVVEARMAHAIRERVK